MTAIQTFGHWLASLLELPGLPQPTSPTSEFLCERCGEPWGSGPCGRLRCPDDGGSQ